MSYYLLILLLSLLCNRLSFTNGALLCATPFDNFLRELNGKISDSVCDIETVNQYNNGKIYPMIRSIVMKDYFRFYKVNLKKDCPFWADNSRCAMRYCQVESCEDKDIPFGIKEDHHHHYYNEDVSSKKDILFGVKEDAHPLHDDEGASFKYLESSQDLGCERNRNGDDDDELGFLNTTISANVLKDIERWQIYDEAQELYCTLPDEDDGAQYVDLSLNPERYTGYKGKPAHKIWRVIYKENCFRPDNVYGTYIQSSKLNGMCIEKRAFYRAISGLHTSINVHLCAQYLFSDQKTAMLGSCSASPQWGPNVEEFHRRFSPETTSKEGLQWLQNLYFLYLVELRALVKAAAYLEQQEYYTGYNKEDIETQKAIKDFLHTIRSFPCQFNESVMFSKGQEAAGLKEEFRNHFLNVSHIMDCVGCDKCRLWGKLQIQGLGTAFKILFSNKFDEKHMKGAAASNKRSFQLARSEIVALFNAFARLSTSIYNLEVFETLLDHRAMKAGGMMF